MPALRVAAPGWPANAGGSGWQNIGRANGSAEGCGADCWLIDNAAMAQVSVDEIVGSGLPIVVAAGDAAIPHAWLDCADAFVVTGDDAAVVAAVLAGAAAARALPGSSTVADFSDGMARTINALSVEASRIAAQLAELAAAERGAIAAVGAVDAGMVRRLIKLRRDRERYFPAEIFADPAWDMLLDLVAARLERRRVPVSSLCIAAAVPTTTALRWVRSLMEAGLFERHTDPTDARRSYVELSQGASEAMLAYLRRFSEVFAVR